MNVNSYVAFGNRERFGGNLAVNLRQHFALYRDWTFWLHTDEPLSPDGYMGVINQAEKEGLLRVTVVPQNSEHGQRWKCLMMLWRMLPLWENTQYVFCRDLDSLLTPRQLQCVRDFISSGKTAHGVNDNAQHSIPLMGGMCGFKTSGFRRRLHVPSLSDLIRGRYSPDNWRSHGCDQTWLMDVVWPAIMGDVLIHRLTGPNCRSDNKHVTGADMSDINNVIRNEGDNFTNYIGAVGTRTDHRGSFSDRQIVDFYNEHGDKEKNAILTDIEKTLGINY